MSAEGILAGLVLENGTTWGESAEPEQWEDASAVLDLSGARRHLWLRSRGRSKTLDGAACWLAAAVTGQFQPGDECYAAAADADQAALIVKKINGLVERSGLAGQVQVERYRVLVPATGVELRVLAADAASSWGLTPAWLTVDELCMWSTATGPRTFYEALMTSLVKNPRSRALLISTPSSPTHWSHKVYESALADPLWRVSHRRGPAPWQSERELESERRRLPESMFRRLFMAEWAEADDVVANLDDVRACVRSVGELGPRSGVHYVTGVDLSTTNDYTVVATCHVEPLDVAGGRRLVVDSLRVWKPTRANPLELSQVEQYLVDVSRRFGGVVRADRHQAWQLVERLKAAGCRSEVVDMTVSGNNHRAQLLHRLLQDRAVSLPARDTELVSEMASLRMRETSPGIYKLDTSESGNGHHDRATAISLAAEILMDGSQGAFSFMAALVDRGFTGRSTGEAPISGGAWWAGVGNHDVRGPRWGGVR